MAFWRGWVAEFYDWRTAFLVVGIRGVALAFVLKLTVMEPIRVMSDPSGAGAQPQPPLVPTVKTLLSNKTILHIAMGAR